MSRAGIGLLKKTETKKFQSLILLKLKQEKFEVPTIVTVQCNPHSDAFLLTLLYALSYNKFDCLSYFKIHNLHAFLVSSIPKNQKFRRSKKETASFYGQHASTQIVCSLLNKPASCVGIRRFCSTKRLCHSVVSFSHSDEMCPQQ